MKIKLGVLILIITVLYGCQISEKGEFYETC